MATTVRKEDRAPGAKPVADKTYHGSYAFYGRAGSGKTTLAATFPGPILYLNVRDNGTDSISDVEGVDVVDIESSEDMRKIILWCVEKASKKKLKYATIIVDTMTQFQQILVEEKGVSKKIKNTGKKRAGDFGTMTKQEWGEIAGDMKALVMDVRGLPLISVFLCQERVFNIGNEEDDNLGQLEPEVGPRMMPSVKDDLNASVSIIGNTFIRRHVEKTKEDGKTVRTVHKEYCLRVGPNEVYTTKIRKPKGVKAPDLIVDPTFRKIQKIVKGKKK